MHACGAGDALSDLGNVKIPTLSCARAICTIVASAELSGTKNDSLVGHRPALLVCAAGATSNAERCTNNAVKAIGETREDEGKFDHDSHGRVHSERGTDVFRRMPRHATTAFLGRLSTLLLAPSHPACISSGSPAATSPPWQPTPKALAYGHRLRLEIMAVVPARHRLVTCYRVHLFLRGHDR